jgi:hypothetical protein
MSGATAIAIADFFVGGGVGDGDGGTAVKPPTDRRKKRR